MEKPKKVWTATQPLYFPPMYMMHRMAQCSDVVLMIEAQFSKRGHQHTALIGTKAGRLQLILPLVDRARQRLSEIYVYEPDKWLKRLEGTLQAAYGKIAETKQLRETMLEGLHQQLQYGRHGMTQAGVCAYLTMWATHTLRLPCQFVYSTELVKIRPLDATDWLLQLGKAVEGDEYLCGKVAWEQYIDHETFTMPVRTQDWTMPKYESAWGMEDRGDVCVIDPLFRHGVDFTRQLLGLKEEI